MDEILDLPLLQRLSKLFHLKNDGWLPPTFDVSIWRVKKIDFNFFINYLKKLRTSMWLVMELDGVIACELEL
jgi:hypothetical protein